MRREEEYRRRLHLVNSEVKRRLDYHVRFATIIMHSCSPPLASLAGGGTHDALIRPYMYCALTCIYYYDCTCMLIKGRGRGCKTQA